MKNLENFLQFEVFEYYGKAELKCGAFDFDSSWACELYSDKTSLVCKTVFQQLETKLRTRNGFF